MGSTRQLRLRFLAALSSGVLLGALPLGCSAENSKEELEPTSCSSGSPMTQCFAPGSTHFNTGNVPNPPPAPTAHFDANGCQVLAEVSDGCCNAAKTGPELVNGECCYGFCTGACCGRPLLVEGQARVAPVTTRGDWFDPVQVDVAHLARDERQALAAQWSRAFGRGTRCLA